MKVSRGCTSRAICARTLGTGFIIAPAGIPATHAPVEVPRVALGGAFIIWVGPRNSVETLAVCHSVEGCRTCLTFPWTRRVAAYTVYAVRVGTLESSAALGSIGEIVTQLSGTKLDTEGISSKDSSGIIA